MTKVTERLQQAPDAPGTVAALLLLLIVSATSCAPAPGSATSTESSRASAEPASPVAFSLHDVRLLDGPFKNAEERDLAYVFALEPDRLLAPYLREAGLDSKAEPYGNWESDGLGGHIGGHYVSALSLLYASTGNTEALERLKYMLSELRRAQDANGTGYLGGVTDSEDIWGEVARGEIEANPFGLNDRWVPWYNLHKTFAGLRDAYRHAGLEEARTMLVRLADWTLRLTENLSDEDIQNMLRAEHGGMNEVLADVAEMTGDAKYLELARRFSHRQILDPLRAREDRLTGLHANTQIPKVIGFERVARVAETFGRNDFADWPGAAAFFWDTVVNRRSVAIGGNSVREHFNPPDDFSSMVDDVQGPETCNTYNMLRLTHRLFERTGSVRYLDYYERALYNHILSTQHPDHGGLVYFTSMRPGHYRVYSQPDSAMWCCVGSGIENHARYGELIYAHAGDRLFVNLFIASTLDWEDRGVRLTQETRFPDAETTTLTIDKPGRFELNVRYPGWVAAGALEVTVNGAPHRVEARPGEYVRIRRDWRAGDRVSLTFPMETRLEPLPDGSDHYAVVHGPIVLAARVDPFPEEHLSYLADASRMGHVASGPLCPLDRAPIIVGGTEDFLQQIERVDGATLAFTAPVQTDGQETRLMLVPFFRVHDSRYVVYLPHRTPEQSEADRRARVAAERERLALAARTVDAVAPGEQQPEVEHGFHGEDTETGIHEGHRWRHARGWFSYDLRDPQGQAAVLQVTYFGLDQGRAFDIFMNDVLVAHVDLDGSRGDSLYAVEYPIPEDSRAKAADGTYVTRFVASPGSIAGGVYGVRLLRHGDR